MQYIPANRLDLSMNGIIQFDLRSCVMAVTPPIPSFNIDLSRLPGAIHQIDICGETHRFFRDREKHRGFEISVLKKPSSGIEKYNVRVSENW